MSVDINWLKEKFGISDEAIRAAKSAEIQPRIDESERVAQSARDVLSHRHSVVSQKEQELEAARREVAEADAQLAERVSELNALYAERDASFQG